jgi:N-dimethylarginine dimethylaminohydrolase
MRTIGYLCKFCKREQSVRASRLATATFLHCQSCFAVIALTESERLALLAPPGFDREAPPLH